MTKVSQILFIVNPVAGGKDKRKLQKKIQKVFPPEIKYKLCQWEYPEQDIHQLIENESAPDTDLVVAVGGDGTINRIANAIILSGKTLGILPLGSGNGIARHLRIPFRISKALKVLLSGKTLEIDACKINDRYFLTTAGIGFDAVVARAYAKDKHRGMSPYIKAVFKTFVKYSPHNYSLEIDGVKLNPRAFLITFANAAQYGGNAFIAPGASVEDGLLDIVVMKMPHFIDTIGIVFKLFYRNINRSPLVKIYKGKKISLVRDSKLPVHYDGEDFADLDKLNIEVVPKALKIKVPEKYKFNLWNYLTENSYRELLKKK